MKIVCLGDSLTKSYKIKKNESWVALADANSEHEWINQGILGDTSVGMLSRLERDCFSYNPQAAILMSGTNDLIQGVTLPFIQSNLACAVHHCKHFGVTPYVGIPILSDPAIASTYWGKQIDFNFVNQQLQLYRSWIMQFCEQFSCPVIDFQKNFLSVVSANSTQEWYIDGLHPNAAGNKVFVESLPGALYKK
ncbi:hypothetical protein JR334_04665 [Clostridia bacterium]|nr:hypothetical protein JR334_04665 [Clostridia bacterium]